MFSRKFQKELFDKKYNSMKQLDRIEMQNKEIMFQNNNNIDNRFYILTFISLFFSLSFICNYSYLLSLGIESLIHIEMAMTFWIIAFICMIIHIAYIFSINIRIRKQIEEREKFLEENTK